MIITTDQYVCCVSIPVSITHDQILLSSNCCHVEFDNITRSKRQIEEGTLVLCEWMNGPWFLDMDVPGPAGTDK